MSSLLSVGHLIRKIPPGFLGIACVAGAVTLFSMQDVAIKWLSPRYPLHELVFMRGCIAMCFILAIFVPMEGGFRNLASARLPLHLLRGLALVVGNMTFFTGLASLPLAEAVAIFFIAPLIITIMAVPVLGERIDTAQVLAVITGLAGVLIIMRPGSAAFQMAALLPLIAAFAYSAMQMMTRKLGTAEKASTMAFYLQFMFIAASGAMWLVAGDGQYAGNPDPSIDFLLRAWSWPTPTDLLIICAVGCINAFGGYFISQGYRISKAAIVAPFEYVAIPLAVLWSILLWNEWPDPFVWFGIALICGAGVFVLHRQAVKKEGAA